MDIKKAKELIKKHHDRELYCDPLEKHVVMRGLQILAKYKHDIRPEFDCNIMLISDFDTTVEQMSEDEVVQMVKLGWFYDKNNDCWTHF